MIARKSAIMLTFSQEDVVKRGHAISSEIVLPIIVKDSVQNISKSSEALDLLTKLGLSDDIQRAKDGKKIRAGRGKMRGRRYKEKKSVLIVGTDTRKLGAFASLPGVDIASVGSLGISKLAPGGKPGRLTVYTESALNQVLEVFK
ncbi:50S ribosomal protein L4P [mine drainage metagenome]|uniref:50S ribosomal protein L4P n=1 Tax=mine drainage metagenome TaxID=410659 RepID=T1BGD4_9ZZZZ